MKSRTEELREVSGNVTFSDALTSFLYQLMRDELPAGKVEKLVRDAVYEADESVYIEYTNGWLAEYAHNLAEKIMSTKENNLEKKFTKVLFDGEFTNKVEKKDLENLFDVGSQEKTELEEENEDETVYKNNVLSGAISDIEMAHKAGLYTGEEAKSMIEDIRGSLEPPKECKSEKCKCDEKCAGECGKECNCDKEEPIGV